MVASVKLSDFDYQLPRELIAQYPLKERDRARMLVVDRNSGTFEHRVFSDIIDYMAPHDLLVINDTKVLASRLLGARKTGGKVEALLLEHKGNGVFEALLKPARLKVGEQISFNNGSLPAVISGRNEVSFSESRTERIYAYGHMPLPPYVKRPAEVLDAEYYQTVYGDKQGAVAAPTAGLHFTHPLLDRIRAKGVGVASVTLHVGVGTFRPVKVPDVSAHHMDKERFSVGEETVRCIRKTRRAAGRIWVVGTTSVRALETLAGGRQQGETDLFIYPGYTFHLVDCLVTNFHLPRTTLLMLVSAFGTKALIMRAYDEAMRKRYRFYSYGDAMLIL